MIDERILKGCRQEKASAQKAFYDFFADIMMAVCLRYVNDKDEAKDVLQEGFIKVFNKLYLFDNKGSLEGWIKRIMINTALDYIRKEKKYRDDVDIDEMEFKLTLKTNAIDKISADEIIELIQNLPVGFRTVFNLHAIEGYTHREIGEQLDISENTSKSQYSRARTAIIKLMQKNKMIVNSE